MAVSPATEWRAYRDSLRERAGDAPPERVVSAVVSALGGRLGWEPPDDLRVRTYAPALDLVDLAIPESVADPALPGRVLEAVLADGVRRSLGAHYTPAAIAAGLTGIAFDAAECVADRGPVATVDPACGGGAFLLAAADRLVASGCDVATVARQSLWGIDRDPVAVAATEAAIALWAWVRGDRTGAHPGTNLAVGDATTAARPWPDPPEVGFDVVVGNPPFLGQLGRDTARSPAETAEVRARLGDAVATYTDASALFLLIGVRLARPGGSVALILPTSVLGARDAAPVRAAATAAADVVGLWTADEGLFDASVRVCAPVLRRRAGPRPEGAAEGSEAARWHGPDFESRPAVAKREEGQIDASWSPYAADLHDVPFIHPATKGTLADVARATAGFRAQYYGLVDHVVEAPRDLDVDDPVGGLAPLVTVGLIDVGRCAWGRRPARFGRRAWERPAVDLRRLRVADERVARWVDDLQVPKVLVATQTRVGEAAVDEHGSWVPSVPTIAVVAPADRLWAVAAVVCSPVASALAVQRTAGTALSATAVKLSARQVLDLPCPLDREAWDAGAAHLRAGDLDAFANAMAAAYGLSDDDPVNAWWHGRQAPVRKSRR